jgi:hypothetical protein
MSYRDDLAALASRHAALASELHAKQREVDDAARVLAHARSRAKLDVLNNIHIASPCPARWDQMSGDERVRACGACNKNVYNVSHMTRAEAEALFVEKEGHLCLRYYQRADGTILLKDCAIGLTKKRRRRWIGIGTAALLAAGGSIVQQAADRPLPDQLAWREIATDTSRKPPPLPKLDPQRTLVDILRDEQGNEYHGTGGVVSIFGPVVTAEPEASEVLAGLIGPPPIARACARKKR